MKHTKQAIEDLNAAYMKDLSQYAHAVNHDLRSLAARIKGLTEQVEAMRDSEERKMFMEHLKKTNTDLLDLIAVWNSELHRLRKEVGDE